MAKMRVFELARELNIPGKDLITRIKGMGITVESNFNVLEEKVIEDIKAKMLEPVSRVEEKGADGEEEESEPQLRKRRIISAQRSKTVHKIQESLGISGPLPADEETRSEVPSAPEVAAKAAETPEAEAAESEEEARPARRRIRQPGSPVTEEEPLEAPVAAEAAEPADGEAPVAEDGAAPVEAPEGTPAVAAEGAAEEEKPAIPSEDLDDEDESRIQRKKHSDVPRWREVRDPDAGDDDDVIDVDPARWQEAVRKVTPAVTQYNYNKQWVRPSRTRRGSERRPVRTGRRSGGRDSESKHVFGPRKKKIRLGQQVTVSSLASSLGVKANEIIKKLMTLGVMANINQPIEGATAELIAAEFNIEVDVDTSDLEDLVREEEVAEEAQAPRPPIVTIMGHVDHGKTSLLDYIRSSQITAREMGGITQHIGAYYVKAESGPMVFLDTPGHEAFTAMRARGADVTDLVVLVVAADDGVMPQTVEAIEHARAAEVPILVAINKMDRPGADPDKIKRQLMEHELLAEEFGGETVMVPVSATSGDGVSNLLEMIHLQAELMELKAPAEGRARGYVVESRMDRRRGPLATVIVTRGTFRAGADFVSGHTFGRVRAMFNDVGEPITEATPSVPVEVLGYDELPMAGDEFVEVADDKVARQVVEQRLTKRAENDATQRRRMHLEDFIQGVGHEEETTLNLVLKADTQGSLEALRASLEKQGNETARVEIVRGGVGGITETDVALAATTNSVVVGFNVRADGKAEQQSRDEGVEIKTYTVIYDAINELRDALQGMLKPIIREEIIGHCEVREIFSMSKEGMVAGSYIKDGRLVRNGLIRLYRDNVLIHSGTIGSLRRFKEDVQNVVAGYECGLRVQNYTDVRVGDMIEAYVKVEEAPVLEEAGRA